VVEKGIRETYIIILSEGGMGTIDGVSVKVVERSQRM